MKYDLGLKDQEAWDASVVAAALPDGAPGTGPLRRLASDELAQVMNSYERIDPSNADSEYTSSFLRLVRTDLGLTDEQIDAVLVPLNLGTLAEFETPDAAA